MNILTFLKKIWNFAKPGGAGSLHNSEVFCIMPWVHFHVTQIGTVTPCCQAPWQEESAFGSINRQSMKEIWNSNPIRSFRKTMLEEKPDTRCQTCYLKEKMGYTSLRQISNKKYQHQFDLALHSPANHYLDKLPVYFDIRFSNVCNLKCRMCGPWSSSSWYNDALNLGMLNSDSTAITRSFADTEKFFDQFGEMIDTLEELYFAGGEPLVSDEHYRLLELLIARGKTKVRLTYNTNFSSLRYKNYDLVELWKQFPDIVIAASLDASEKRGELLRKNLDWNTVIANRKRMMNELPHVEFVVSPTLNAYNLMHLPDFHRDWVEKCLIRVEDFMPGLLVKPAELAITILPQALKEQAIEKYKKHLSWMDTQPSVNSEKRSFMFKQFENILTCLSGDEHDKTENFIKNSQTMDKLRKENTADIFPELRPLFEKR